MQLIVEWCYWNKIGFSIFLVHVSVFYWHVRVLHSGRELQGTHCTQMDHVCHDYCSHTGWNQTGFLLHILYKVFSFLQPRLQWFCLSENVSNRNQICWDIFQNLYLFTTQINSRIFFCYSAASKQTFILRK